MGCFGLGWLVGWLGDKGFGVQFGCQRFREIGRGNGSGTPRKYTPLGKEHAGALFGVAPVAADVTVGRMEPADRLKMLGG